MGQQGDLIFTPEDRAANRPEVEMKKALTEGRAADERWHVKRDGTCSGPAANSRRCMTAACTAFSRSCVTIPNSDVPPNIYGQARNGFAPWLRNPAARLAVAQQRRAHLGQPPVERL